MKDGNRPYKAYKSVQVIALVIIFLLLSCFFPGGGASFAQVVQAADNTNVTQGKTATSSSYMLPYGPNRAVDGKYAPISRWVVSGLNVVSGQWMKVDLGGYYTCNRWSVQGIESSWSGYVNNPEMYALGGYTLLKGVYDNSFSAVDIGSGSIDKSTERFTARYVMLRLDQGSVMNNNWAAVQEFEVYGYPTALPAITNDIPVVFKSETEVAIQSNIINDGGDNVTERGIVYSTSPDPLITNDTDTKITSGSGTGSYTVDLAGLDPHTTYYVKAYAKNIIGTSYGKTISFNISRAVDVAISGGSANTVYGQATTYTATLSVPVPSVNTHTPTGTVSFKDGDTILGTISLNGLNAEYTVNYLTPGAHNITAFYNGDTDCDSNTSAVSSQTVGRASTTTALASSSNPSVYGQPVTYTATVSATAPGGGIPTGNVTFRDNGALLATVPITNGTAAYTAATPAVASHNITASYNESANYNYSNSNTLVQVVNKAATAVTLSGSSATTVYGQSVTITTTVSSAAPGSGTPAGTVTFKDGTTTLGAVTLSGGAATLTTSTLSVGNHDIIVDYSGNANYNSATSQPYTLTVNKAATISSLSANLNPSIYGQNVTYTATVTAAAPGAGIPTGTVTFKDGETTVGIPVSLAGGSATLTTQSLSVGSHSLTVLYNGDGNFTSSVSDALTQTVNKLDSTTTLSSAVNPSTYGQVVSFTAGVTSGATGTVTFTDGAVTLGTAELSNGEATFMTSSLGGGSHSITASYAGDSTYNASTSSGFTQVVNPAVSVLELTNSPSTSGYGQDVTLTAVLPSDATGMVTFKADGSAIGTASLSGGTATLTISTLSAGDHTFTAEYGGDLNYAGSTSADESQIVNKVDSAVALASSVNPSSYLGPVTYTATVTEGATGTVTFKDGGTDLGSPVVMSGGEATFTTSSLAVGNHTITAEYSGNGNFNGSTSDELSQAVNLAASSTSLTISPEPSTYGQSITLTAAVTSGATGSVTFMDGTVALETVALSGDAATLTTSVLAGGSHNITAEYSGDANFGGSSSAWVAHMVNPAVQEITLLSTANPSDYGQGVGFTAAVAPNATGSVTFKDGASVLGTEELSGGAASFATSGLSAGSHSITVVYSGDSNYASGTSTVLTQTVNAGASTVTLSGSPNPSVYGQPVTFTAAVTTGAAGTVSFSDGAELLGTASLTGEGTASLTISSLGVGNHSISAVYAGDANYNASSSMALTHTVNAAATTAAVTGTPNPSENGQSVTFTATINAVSPGSGTPTGTVSFKDGATSLGTAALSGGTATFTTAGLGKGTYSITAEYSGNGSYNSCVSAQYDQLVGLNAADKVAADKAAIVIGFASGDNEGSVTKDISLPLIGSVYDSVISWESEDTGLISINGDTGEVTRPLFGSGNADITVTAAVYNGSESDTRIFNLTVIELPQVTHTIVFRDWDGEVLSTQTVPDGEAAAAPEDPTREGYIFAGWDKDYSNITTDLEITALYTIAPPVFTDADKVAADKTALQIGFAQGDDADSVRGDIVLPDIGSIWGSQITWTSSDTDVITDDGTVFRPASYKGNAEVTVTAYVYCNGASDTEDFDLTVLKLPRNHDDSDNDSNDNNNKNNKPEITVSTTTVNNGPETTVTVTTATTVAEASMGKNGEASAVVTPTQVTEAVERAIQEAALQEGGAAAVAEIRINAPEAASSVEAVIPGNAIAKASESGISALTVSTPIASMTFDSKSLDAISAVAAGSVSIKVSKVETEALPEEVPKFVGDRPVFDFSVTSGGKEITQFGGSVTVSIPYAPKAGEDTNAIVIYYVNGEGKLETIRDCVYDSASGTIRFTTSHFSRYAIGYNKVNFTDVAEDSWYENAVTFTSARGISNGTGNGKYGPQDRLTRGQFLVMAMRAFEIAPDENPSANFADAGNTYYTGYLAAAKRLGLTKGTGEGRYSPDKEISRQEMFSLLYGILKSAGKLPENGYEKELSAYEDSDRIAVWAKDAMSLFVRTGTIKGSNGRLDPEALTSRAEMSQVLYNLISEY